MLKGIYVGKRMGFSMAKWHPAADDLSGAVFPTSSPTFEGVNRIGREITDFTIKINPKKGKKTKTTHNAKTCPFLGW